MLYYSAEKNKQILISLLKQYNIRNIIVSPGATNVTFVGSIQNDSFFTVYSCVDERSAAYLAIGLSDELSEPVVLSCTGATSSRNYYPALTEAYERGLPILAITSSLSSEFVRHDYPQVTVRDQAPQGMFKSQFLVQNIKDANDYWDCTIKINQALNMLFDTRKYPIHINLETVYDKDFSVKTLPVARFIKVIKEEDKFPSLSTEGRIAIFIASHKKFNDQETKLIERFCELYDAVVLCDHTSNYYGRYKLNAALIYAQEEYVSPYNKYDLIIHLGDISGDYYTCKALFNSELWRVSEDGIIKDRFRDTKFVFKMRDQFFFQYYINNCASQNKNISLFSDLQKEYNKVKSHIPELPFSNIWIASFLSSLIPVGSCVHLGILNSLRAWNFFNLPEQVSSYCNVGGFGIDGCLSSLVGSALANSGRLFFCVLGDLAFFYDINALLNTEIKNNIRILVVNNGRGTEFRNYGHFATVLGKDADPYVAAAGHFGNQSPSTIKDFAESFGFKYLSATDKESFINNSDFFLDSNMNQSVIYEVFTDSKDESDALRLISHAVTEKSAIIRRTISKMLRYFKV